MPAPPPLDTTADSLEAPPAESRRCDQCGTTYDPREVAGGNLCFECRVHWACACADDPDDG